MSHHYGQLRLTDHFLLVGIFLNCHSTKLEIEFGAVFYFRIFLKEGSDLASKMNWMVEGHALDCSLTIT